MVTRAAGNYNHSGPKKRRFSTATFRASTIKAPVTLGQRLTALRRQTRWTAEQLAQRAGVHTMTIDGWENGWAPPQPLELARVAQALGVALEALSGRVGKTFGERLQRGRIERGLTQTQVARKLGLHRTSISDWERDVWRPSEKQRKRLERVLGRPLP